jgi:hypothetical protein
MAMTYKEVLLKQWRDLQDLPSPKDEAEAEERGEKAKKLLEEIERIEKAEGRVEPRDEAEVRETRAKFNRVSKLKQNLQGTGLDIRDWWVN